MASDMIGVHDAFFDDYPLVEDCGSLIGGSSSRDDWDGLSNRPSQLSLMALPPINNQKSSTSKSSPKNASCKPITSLPTSATSSPPPGPKNSTSTYATPPLSTTTYTLGRSSNIILPTTPSWMTPKLRQHAKPSTNLLTSTSPSTSTSTIKISYRTSLKMHSSQLITTNWSGHCKKMPHPPVCSTSPTPSGPKIHALTAAGQKQRSTSVRPLPM